MNLLAIDTAQSFCSACILATENGRVGILHSERDRIGRGHAEKLFSTIEAALNGAAIGRGDIDRIAVNTGPGSFTGLRVGIAAARGLALALDCDCVGVNALECLAQECGVGPETIHVLLDAGRNQVVCQSFDGSTLQAIAPHQTLTLEQARDRFRNDGILTGSGVAPCFPDDQADSRSAHRAGAWPDIETIARLGAEKPQGQPPKPLYSRAADAKPQISAELVAAPSAAATPAKAKAGT